MASGYPFPVFAFTDIYRKKLFHQIDERERAFQSKFAVDFELEGYFFVHFFVSGVDVRSAAVVELGRIGIERKVDAQRRADDGDLCHDVAFASICVALFADAALDLGRAFLGCGERVLQDRIAFLDDIVGKRVFFGESEALASGFFRHNFVIVEFFAERRLDLGHVFGFFFDGCRSGLRLVHFLKSGCAGHSDALVAEGAKIVCAAHIAALSHAVVPFLFVKFCLQCKFVHGVLPNMF